MDTQILWEGVQMGLGAGKGESVTRGRVGGGSTESLGRRLVSFAPTGLTDDNHEDGDGGEKGNNGNDDDG